MDWKVMPQLPYSPALAPSDLLYFHLFGPMKDELRGHRFETADDVKRAVREWVKKTESAFFRAGLRRWAERWEKCMQAGGDCFED